MKKNTTRRRKWNSILVALLLFIVVEGVLFCINISSSVVLSPDIIAHKPCLIFLEEPSVHIPQPLPSITTDYVEKSKLSQKGLIKKEMQNYLLQVEALREKYIDTVNDPSDTTIIPLTCDGKLRYLKISEKPHYHIQISLNDYNGKLLDSIEQPGLYSGCHIVSLHNKYRVWFQFYTVGATGYWQGDNGSIVIHDDKIELSSQYIGYYYEGRISNSYNRKVLLFFKNISTDPTIKKIKFVWDPFNYFNKLQITVLQK